MGDDSREERRGKGEERREGTSEVGRRGGRREGRREVSRRTEENRGI